MFNLEYNMIYQKNLVKRKIDHWQNISNKKKEKIKKIKSLILLQKNKRQIGQDLLHSEILHLVLKIVNKKFEIFIS